MLLWTARDHFGPPQPRPTKKAKKSKHARIGRPPIYPIELIELLAYDCIETYGLPKTQALLGEKVQHEWQRNGFGELPSSTRFKELMAVIHKHPERPHRLKRLKGHKGR
jgi:hypothetical protein